MYKIRNAIETDFNFISSTLKSAELFNADRRIMFDIFMRTCNMYILTPADDDDLICACLLMANDNLVWLYVKEIYRRAGIAKYMIQHAQPKQYYMLKGKGDTWKNLQRRTRLKWNPYLILNMPNFINQ